MTLRILGLVPGDIGTMQLHYNYLFSSIAAKHSLIDVFHVHLSPLDLFLNLLRCICPNRRKPFNSKRLNLPTLARRLNLNAWAFRKKTQFCESTVRDLHDKIDLVLQWGTAFSPFTHATLAPPYFVYNDCTIMMSKREYPDWVPFDSSEDLNQWLKLETEVYRKAATVFTMSEYARRSLIEDYGIAASRVVTVYAGPLLGAVSRLKKSYEKKTILFVGRDFKRKGGVTLLKAFKEVLKHVKDAKLIIVGTKVRVTDRNIVTTGFINRNHVLSLFEDASIFVMPSVYEPLGLVFLEAMKYATPCIGSTCCAMPEIIEEGKTGFLIPPNDFKKLAERIVLLLENENLMREMGKNGLLRVEKLFTWDKVVDRMSKRFEHVFA